MELKKIRILLLLLLIPLTGCYYLSWGIQQIKVSSGKIHVQNVLTDEKFEQDKKEKIRLVIKAKELFSKTIGIPFSENYSYYYPKETKYYVVTACKKLAFSSYYWDYPLIGKLPYKSFMSQDDADSEAKSLQSMEYDTLVNAVRGYSTLGYFADPLFPHHLEMSDRDLVELILHELVHEYFYFSDDTVFSESLATFISDKLTAQFYNDSFEPKKSLFLPTLYKLLNYVYDMPLYSNIEKLEWKVKIYSTFNFEPNNCLLKDYFIYNSTEQFQRLWDKYRSWKDFIDVIKEAVKSDYPWNIIKRRLVSKS
ncbi:MAG: aminopeptidase [Planctomycetes bacterium]|nr:aminopeptidase [Planctomycetota bacterium]